MTDLAAGALRQVLGGKRLLIFDFDGTVADTTPLHAAAFAEVLAPLAVPVDYPSIAGLKTLDAMHVCLLGAQIHLPDEQVDALVMAKQKCVRAMIVQGLQPVPCVDGFLRWAWPRYRLAMVTSGSRGTVSLALEKLGYTRWFEPLICAEDVAQAKPDAGGFLRALQITGVPAKQGLVFEDSDAGVQAACSAGLDFIDVREISWDRVYCAFR